MTVINTPNHLVIKFSDDTALVALLEEGEDPVSINAVVEWCDRNGLILNPLKTEEVIFGATENINTDPVTISNQPIKQSSFKYLGVHVDSALSWDCHMDFICNKVQQRIHFLRQLRSF